MIENITGIILAGGKSTRVGTNKAFLKIGKKTIIEQILAKFKEIFRETIVVVNEIQKFDSLKVRIIQDLISSKGPLGGIYTGLVKSNSFYNFIIGCDMPFINNGLVEHIASYAQDFDIVMPKVKERYEPLCALYSKRCIATIEGALDKDSLRIVDVLPLLNVKLIDEAEIKQFDPEFISFKNINTREDYRTLAS
jgi:molybdopterin-guanine dinucleotide biosynthesis protein A